MGRVSQRVTAQKCHYLISLNPFADILVSGIEQVMYYYYLSQISRIGLDGVRILPRTYKMREEDQNFFPS